MVKLARKAVVKNEARAARTDVIDLTNVKKRMRMTMSRTEVDVVKFERDGACVYGKV